MSRFSVGTFCAALNERVVRIIALFCSEICRKGVEKAIQIVANPYREWYVYLRRLDPR